MERNLTFTAAVFLAAFLAACAPQAPKQDVAAADGAAVIVTEKAEPAKEATAEVTTNAAAATTDEKVAAAPAAAETTSDVAPVAEAAAEPEWLSILATGEEFACNDTRGNNFRVVMGAGGDYRFFYGRWFSGSWKDPTSDSYVRDVGQPFGEEKVGVAANADGKSVTLKTGSGEFDCRPRA